MKFLLSTISLLTVASSANGADSHVGEDLRECCSTETYYSGYVRYFKRSYFNGDNGEYYTVAHKDQVFRDRIADLLREHNTETDSVCYRVKFCGRIGGDSGDLVNKNIEIHRGISFELIDCPSS